jgi:glycosyltransferase involved in cell wall biosynthesis
MRPLILRHQASAAEHDALVYHRITAPVMALAREPGVTCTVARGRQPLPPPPPGADAFLIVYRPAVTDEAELANLKDLLAAGYLLVADVDDHPDAYPGLAASGYLTYRAFHAIQTSTAPLAELLGRFNPTVAVFANAIEPLLPLRPPPARDDVRLFFGAFNRDQDWRPIMPELNRVLAAAPVPIHVDVVREQAFFDALATPHRTFTPLCGYNDYLEHLDRADIALMPLLDHDFNHAKSDLKFIEAAARGAVALAPTVVYGASIRPWETGAVYADPAEFGAALDRLIREPALRARLRAAAHAYIADARLLSHQVATRAAWYRDLAARREALTQALLARVPALSTGRR